MNIEKLWDKYKDIIPYGVFGVLTTLVNIVSYWIFAASVWLIGYGEYCTCMDFIGSVCISY